MVSDALCSSHLSAFAQRMTVCRDTPHASAISACVRFSFRYIESAQRRICSEVIFVIASCFYTCKIDR